MEMEMIAASHDPVLVGLSFFIAVFGSFTALQLARGLSENRTEERSAAATFGWVLSAAIALGGGAIWSMHFIAMLAYEMPMAVGYDIGLTFASLALAVAVVAIGIYVAGTRNTFVRLLLAGAITGLGVAAMHYTGMAAMVMQADIHYDSTLVAVSIAIAIAAATAALWLAFNLKGNLQRFGSALIMGLAVSGMHYTGMSAVTMVGNDTPVALAGVIAPLTLGLLIFCFTMLVLVLCLLVALTQFNRNMYQQLGAESALASEH